MPALSMFLNIIVRMFVGDCNPPHFHAACKDFEATFSLDGDLSEGGMPAHQRKLIAAWA